MIKKIFYIAICLFFVNTVQAQSNIDIADSLANEQKYYTIQIDVANGKIYLPTKKKVVDYDSTKNLFVGANKLFVPGRKFSLLYKDSAVDGKIKRIPNGDTLFYNTIENSKTKYIVKSKNYLTPKVGNFIKLVFTNVPKHEDVNTTVSFNNKNQEGASVLNNVLSKYQGSFENAVNKDTSNFNKKISETAEIKKINENLLEIETTKSKNAKTILNNSLIQINKINEKIDSLKTVKSKNTKNTDAVHKLAIAKEIKESINILLNDTSIIKSLGTNNINNLTKATKKLEDIDDYIDAAIKIIDKQELEYHNILTAIENYKLYIKEASKDLQTKYKSTIDSLVKEKNRGDSIYKALHDSIFNNRTIRIIPFQVDNSDMSVISLNFLRDGKLYAEREIILKNNHGFKMDFSTGFVAATLKDDNYRLYNRGSDSSAILSDSKGKFAVGFGFLVHAYFRTGSRANFALTSGFALNGSNQTVNYLLGASIPLGLEERFVISAGAIFGKVKQLSSGYNVSENLDSLINNSPTYTGNHWYKAIANTGVPLTEKWKTGFFVGITYNLGELIGTKRNKSFKVN